MLRKHLTDLPELPSVQEIDEMDVDNWTPEDPAAVIEAIDRRNVWHRIDNRLRLRLKRIQYELMKEARLEEDRKRAALRGPPTNCRRNGYLLEWDPPDIEGGEKPECYFVEGKYKGEWTTFQPPIYPHEPLRKMLYTDEVAHVAAYYPNEPRSLGWGYRRGPDLHAHEPEPEPTRMDLIVEASKTFTGRRTRDGRPYVRHLRKHARMPDITTSERNEAHERIKDGNR